MPVFFAGRLWVSPATMSTVDDSAMANQNLSVGNVVALIGQSVGGQPNTPITFGDPTTAAATLISGELLTAVQKAFNPSDEVGGAASVVVVRVNPAVQAALTLLDSSAAAAVNLASADWGAWTNQIKVKVQAGSVQGLQATTQYGTSYYTQDNIYRNAFSIQYTGGAASASMSVTGTNVILQAPSGTQVSSIDLTQMKTIQQLVDAIDVVPGFTATVLDGNGQQASLNGLDYVTAQDIKTALYTATANLQALIDWFNSTAQGYVVATRATNAGKVPAAIPFTYLAGGSDGVTTNTQWSNAFTALQNVDVRWVTPVSSDPSIAAMTDAHVQYMSTTGRKERRAICGTALGTTDVAAIAAAKAINSDRTSLVHLGYWDYDDDGELTLFAPYLTAAIVAGAFSGVNPGTPLTNKSITVRGLERNLNNPTDTDPLINGGVLCVENTSSGYKIVKSISTWLVNKNYNRVEQSVGTALDFTVRNVREALDVLRGAKATPQNMARAVSIADTALRQLAVAEPNGPGVLVGDAKNPAYKNIQATLSGDVIGVQFQCSPVLPINYIPVSVFAVPYSGTASA
ncbi:MAG TPA: phage tail sheath subtilisin-like domain-containing protein [Paraburkholderia sp.]